MSTSIRPVLVSDSPKITCFSDGAHLGDKNVYLRCEVRSKPRVSALFWIIDVNGTTLSQGEVVNEYWTLVKVRANSPTHQRVVLIKKHPWV